jgi:hypothetical protein
MSHSKSVRDGPTDGRAGLVSAGSVDWRPNSVSRVSVECARNQSRPEAAEQSVCSVPACVGALFAPRATQSAGLRVGQINAALDYLRRQRVTCELSRLPESSSIVGRPGIRPTADCACFLVDVRADL